MIRRPTVEQLAPRRFRLVDIGFEPIGRDQRPLGLGLVAASIGLFIFVHHHLAQQPLLPIAIVCVGVLGVLVIIRAPLWRTKRILLELDLSEGVLELATEAHNGSGAGWERVGVDDVDELLFAMRQTPIDARRPERGQVDAFALYLRTFDGEVHPIVEASLDHDRTFGAARFLADALDVGIKQVGKGWRSS